MLARRSWWTRLGGTVGFSGSAPWYGPDASCVGRAQALVVLPLAAAGTVEPNRLQRGLFIAAFVVVIGAALWWVRRRGDAARWRQRQARVYADVQAVERDAGGVCATLDPVAAATAWTRLEPRVLVSTTELTQLASTASNEAQVADVNRVLAALEHLGDELRRCVAFPPQDDTGPGAEAARQALRTSLAPPPG
jgi:hypothetical protein